MMIPALVLAAAFAVGGAVVAPSADGADLPEWAADHASTADEPPGWPDSWTYTPPVEVLPAADARVDLFGSVSGFAKARTDRTSITVGPMPFGDLTPILDAWNTAAGWALFVQSTAADTDVSFTDLANEPGCVALEALACTGWDQFDSGWYRHCYIAVPFDRETPANTVEHELGHCLGFEDPDAMFEFDSDPGYTGIMSYSRDRSTLTLGEQDVASLVDVGYRDAP